MHQLSARPFPPPTLSANQEQLLLERALRTRPTAQFLPGSNLQTPPGSVPTPPALGLLPQTRLR